MSSFSVFAAAPDLQVWGPSTRPYVDYRSFPTDSCEVREGCTQPGTRRLLHFEAESRNYGTADLVFGDPAQNPRFVWDPCHNHYHFGQFMNYRLLDTQGNVVLEGRKVGFCLEDTVKWDPNAGVQRYNCGYQGIQRGWADRYTYDVPCQFLDITGVAPGTYILDIIVDPLNFIPELDDSNNETQVTVEIPPEACSIPPSNDYFPNAITVYSIPAVVYGENSCATKQPWEPSYAGNYGGRSVWWRWVAPSAQHVVVNTEGSTFDTLLGVFRHIPNNTVLIAENDDIVYSVVQWSQVEFDAVEGQEYRIVVDGFDGATGSVVLRFDPPPNDDFSGCQPISGSTGSLTGHNIGATREPNEPTHVQTYGSHSVWYCWTAPKAGTVEWSTIGSDFDTTLAIYRGDALNALTPVAGDNDSGAGGTSKTRFTAVSNTVYRIAIDARADGMGHIALNWNYVSGRLAVRRSSNGSVILTITGADGTYTLQSSSNLTSWSPAGSVTVVNGTGTTTQANNTARRFYRAVLPAQ
ncbi:MAG TPA: lysyl oxidase family protein [Verrucomicrobiae bacterium]|nr:lysyl oxidase family protein [Verrucomicrobiae bacterium]